MNHYLHLYFKALPEDDGDDAIAGNSAASVPSFPDLEVKIAKGIQQLGGNVFPKLNWSAPRDASWIANTGTLKCNIPGEIFLLLKASDFVTHDLTAAFECCPPPLADGDLSASESTEKDIKYTIGMYSILVLAIF